LQPATSKIAKAVAGSRERINFLRGVIFLPPKIV